ncbi:MAG: hypothetical protein Q7T33_09355 [Dehalococcoidia bacterium]|nr:hypothetical protein [Dehalococcoidia bacterium]
MALLAIAVAAATALLAAAAGPAEPAALTRPAGGAQPAAPARFQSVEPAGAAALSGPAAPPQAGALADAPALQPGAVAAQPGSAPPVVSSSAALDAGTAASSWSMAPIPVAPAPAPTLAPAAATLAAQAKAAYGIDIVLDGQDWGTDEAPQLQNIGAVISAMDRLPVTVASSIASSPAGPLAVLSNTQGRTQDGWQPYGDAARSFYTNSDQGPAGHRAAHEIVLAAGAGPLSVAHELLHAYQFRDVAPGEYVLALLGGEMRSFIAATGWRPLASDEAVRAAVHEPWQTIDSLYVYEGRALTYVDENGAAVTVRPANPLEAFAIAGALYYARPGTMPLPDWPEYWAWFDARLGAPRLSS